MDRAEGAAPEGPGRAAGWLPGLEHVRAYQRAWLAPDLAAGLALTGILVPAGMAYAEASGLSVATVRTQLKAVFQKTTTSRQAELVSLLLHVPG